MNAPTIMEAPQDPNSLEEKWEEIFAESLENKNLTVKDIETAKYMFFSGAHAIFQLIEQLRPASSAMKHIVAAGYAIDQIKEEITTYLHLEEEETVWMTVSSHQKDEDGQENIR